MKLMMRALLTLLAVGLLAGYYSAEAQVTYTIGGNLAGLADAKSLTLLNNGTNPLTLSANGGFTFAGSQAAGSYAVTVAIQPSGQTCSVTNGSGSISGANVTNITVTCSNTYTVGGTVSGLTGSGLVLKMNSSNLIVATGASSFKFSTSLLNGAAYAVSVGIQPVGQTCAVSNGTGVVSGANIANISISCASTYTVSGTISGLTSPGLVLKLKASNLLVASGATTFKFSTALPTGVTYLVGIFAQPAGQFCLVNNGSGTIGAANVTNVVVVCSIITVPGAPTIGNAIPGDASASIAFTAPASDGGAAITSYTVACVAGATTVTATGAASPITVLGLTNLTAYSCSVTATNSIGTGAASAVVSVTPHVASSGTAAVLCPYSQSTPNITLTAGVTATSTSSWTCSGTLRSMTANGIPNHLIGTFPNPGNPNVPTVQSVSFSAPLAPVLGSANAGLRAGLGYALNGVKFDPGTGGTCPGTATKASDCAAIGTDQWKLEALGIAKTFFNFGTDMNNAHVQPTGMYHYHGMPEGLLTYLGENSNNPTMVLIGWAPDGYPMYARYGHTVPTDPASPLKVITASWGLKTTPDAGRPSTTDIPMGVFLQDYQYYPGTGDLDDCNGRFDVTPEFPAGIYHYYATDTWPYFPRCWKGVVN